MSTNLLTQAMLKDLHYDIPNVCTPIDTFESIGRPTTVMVLFEHSDINAAVYHMSKTIEDPESFRCGAIATVLVEECIKEIFKKKLLNALKTQKLADNNNASFGEATENLKRLNANAINFNNDNGTIAIMVDDFSHEHVGSYVNGIITLHAFRTNKECIALIKKESLEFTCATIWHENHSYAYELIAALTCKLFYINCFRINLSPLKSKPPASESYVTMDERYHYETFVSNGVLKSTIFPIGSIFAN
ncbi:uncharacterized protein LOC119637641 isoform X2 [Glossina fuscipes]|uniref:Uncharacterized protein LOC119637641 isoform X2 n=1 Tax=Glossina fuscipes TaxID=7396 RepID=A0A9C6DKB3_9MUSC|nr:uncharacterized protein LOC119637641 isoform X2 [Glossina fuscipes]